MSAARILVVEDEAIVAEDLRDLLEGLRYEVVALVSSGLEAIAKTVALRPDLVLMDIKLKGAMEGIEAAVTVNKRVHQSSFSRRLPMNGHWSAPRQRALTAISPSRSTSARCAQPSRWRSPLS